jgi:hypothetical protein
MRVNEVAPEDCPLCEAATVARARSVATRVAPAGIGLSI